MGIAALTAGNLQVADAGVSCKMVRSWCPAVLKADIHHGAPKGDDDRAPTSVPEPEMLALLGAGAAAVGAAALRRRKNKKE
jgi:hypothetical protein